MQALTNRKKQVERKPMTFWEKMYLPAIAVLKIKLNENG